MSKELAEVCRLIGKDITLVQGAGGNVSVKGQGADGGLMRIKASGVPLGDVTADHGHILIDHHMIASFLDRLPHAPQWSNGLEKEYVAAMRDARREEHAMPSLETGFHSFLSEAVIHTHPMSFNAYACSVEGPDILRNLFPTAIIVPYTTIGVVLSRAVRAGCATAGDGRPIFLLNHGLIVHDTTLEQAYLKTKEIVGTIEADLGRRGIPVPAAFKFQATPDGAYSEGTAKLVTEGKLGSLDDHLFPDSAVYSPRGYRGGGTILLAGGGIIAPSLGAAEIAHACAYIALAAEGLGGVRPMPLAESMRIAQMETEKYRQRGGE